VVATKTEDKSLSTVTLLQDLPAETRARIAGRCRWRRFGPGQVIIEPESVDRDVFFIASGRVRVVNFGPQGREVSYCDIEAGGSFGELAAIDGGPRSAQVQALDNVLAAALDARTFRQLVEEEPRFAMAVMNRLAGLVRASSTRILDISTLGAHNRVHAELLRLARLGEREDGTARIEPIPQQAELAARVSTVRETVARVMSDLTKRGILQRDKSALVITDIERLEDLVDSVHDG
jgi:CRP-like cAMP-binding protein